MATEVLWWIFAVAIVATSIGVVTSRSVIHSAIFLIGSLAGVGALYIFLTVEFLALTQFLIYGGAVTVLILLALMLTRGGGAATDGESMFGAQWPFGLGIAAGLGAILVGVVTTTSWPGDEGAPFEMPIELISQQMFEFWGAPFIIASALLLVAAVGAIILARQEDGE